MWRAGTVAWTSTTAERPCKPVACLASGAGKICARCLSGTEVAAGVAIRRLLGAIAATPAVNRPANLTPGSPHTRTRRHQSANCCRERCKSRQSAWPACSSSRRHPLVGDDYGWFQHLGLRHLVAVVTGKRRVQFGDHTSAPFLRFIKGNFLAGKASTANR